MPTPIPLPPALSSQGIRIAGTGMAIPAKLLTNEDLTKMVDTTDEWIVQRTGIKVRHIAEEGTNVRDYALAALRDALAAAGMGPKDLDMLIVATLTPEMAFPSTAARVVSALGAVPAAAMDISVACSGFVYGLNVAQALLRTGPCRTIAVVGSELLSRITDWKNRNTCVLFGDGAGAVILTVDDDPSRGCIRQSMYSNGDLWPELYCPRGPQDLPTGDRIFSGAYNTLQMNGREVYKFAVPTLLHCIDQTLKEAGITPDQLAMVIPHQSNLRIMESAREKMGLPVEKMYINIDRYGNTSAASIPIALHEVMAAGKLKKGDLVLFVALGGGLTWASSLWRL